MDERKINVYSDFLGWGNVKEAKIIFLGYEPGAPIESAPQNISQEDKERIFQVYTNELRDGLLPRESWHKEWDRPSDFFESEFEKAISDKWWPHRQTEILQVYFSLIALKRIFGISVDDTWEKNNIQLYNVKEFCRRYEIQVNLFPIAKSSKSSDYSKETKLFLGFEENTPAHKLYEAILSTGRYSKLEQLFNEKLTGRAITICMGGFSDNEENELKTKVFHQHKFSEKGWNSPFLKSGRNVSISLGGDVVFTPHPARGGWNRKFINNLVEEIDLRFQRTT